MNIKRGRESHQHLELKRKLIEHLKACGWLVYPEYRNCDVVAYSMTTGEMVGIEIECTGARNFTNNFQRTMKSEWSSLWIVAANENVRRIVKAHVDKLSIKDRVFLNGVVRIDEICLITGTLPRWPPRPPPLRHLRHRALRPRAAGRPRDAYR